MDLGIIKNRKYYTGRLKELKLKQTCGFCCINKSLIIKVYENWVWMFSEFPYWKYHTILFCKRHIGKISELKNKEIIELPKILSEIENTYIKAKIFRSTSNLGVDIICRQRFSTTSHPTAFHLHIHISPSKEGRLKPILDPNAHLIDTSLIMNSIN